jgi:hypothetical protein
MAVNAKRRHQSGQAAVELSVCLPFLIFLIYYTFKAFFLVHTAQVAQRYDAMSLWQRVDNRAKFVLDDVDNRTGNGGGRLHGHHYMAVRYAEEDGGFPHRGIIGNNGLIINVIGICLEPDCSR